MANTLFSIQISIPSSVKTPIVSGDRRLTLMNLANLIRGLNGGTLGALSGASAYLQANPTLVAASATATCAGVLNADTVTIAGTALTATQRRATGTVTAAAALAADTVTINGVVFTAVAGAATPGTATFSIDTGNTETATSLAAQVNAYASPLLTNIVRARSAAAVVTFYAFNQGTSGNAITLASSNGGRLAVSAATLTGGAAIANNTFDFAGTNALTGDAMAAAINASTTAAVQQVTAASNGAGVVTLTAKFAGVAGNAITWVSSNGSRLAVTGSGFLASGSQGAVTRWSL